MPRLIVESPEEMKPKAFELLEKVISIGAEEENAIHLAHSSVSGCHLDLTWASGDYQVADLGSTNGSYINGEAVTKGMLHNGDHLQVGEVVMLYESEVVPRESDKPKEDNFALKPKPVEPKEMVIERKILETGVEIKIGSLPSLEPKKRPWDDIATSVVVVILLFVLAFGIGAGIYYLLHILL